MAVAKLFKGLSTKLSTSTTSSTTHEGYIYFTPDDGKIYIDVETGTSPTIGTNSTEGNRICLNANELQDDLVFNCGDSTTV